MVIREQYYKKWGSVKETQIYVYHLSWIPWHESWGMI